MVLIRKYRVPAYRTRLWVVVSPSLMASIDKVEDLLDHKIIKDKDRKSTRAYTYCFEDHKGRYQMLCFYNPHSKPGEIAHEAKHTLNIIYQWHGVKLSLTNDEPECYLLEWMVDRIHQTIKDFKK